MKGGLEGIIDAIVGILSMMFLMVMPYYGVKLTVVAHERSPIPILPRYLWCLCIPLPGFIMIGYSIRDLVVALGEIRNSVFRQEQGETQTDVRQKNSCDRGKGAER
ncbi:MAG: hypothetical protein JSV55_01525 [Deltaproteobacteria bacterium]|nr:MAG: hypothetical protein JSV55_01525 [Deltaproteobacteria bacterium]